MADFAAVKQEEEGSGKQEAEEEDQRSSSTPRNEHDGKIVTSEQSNENGGDDCSDLTDNHVHQEDETPKSFPQKVSTMYMLAAPRLCFVMKECR